MMQRFGQKLRTLRTRRGLSYRQLARMLDISHSHLLRLETGEHKPSVDLILKIARLFEVSFDQLMDDNIDLD